MAKAYLTGAGWRKTCCTCKKEFDLSAFSKSTQTPDGLFPRCKLCARAAVVRSEQKRIDAGLGRLSDKAKENVKARKRSAYAQDPEKFRALSRLNRSVFSEKTQASSLASKQKRPDYYRVYAKNYYHQNKHLIGPRNRESSMRRYANQGRSEPLWSDKPAIDLIYAEAFRLTNETGVPHQVDHIVPITSKIVCGLHVSNNMQILRKSENVKKGNRFWPGHPDDEKDRLGRAVDSVRF